LTLSDCCTTAILAYWLLSWRFSNCWIWAGLQKPTLYRFRFRENSVHWTRKAGVVVNV